MAQQDARGFEDLGKPPIGDGREYRRVKITSDINAPSLEPGDVLTLVPVTDIGRQPRGVLMLLEFERGTAIQEAVIGRTYPQRDGGLIVCHDNDPDAGIACHVADVRRAWVVYQLVKGQRAPAPPAPAEEPTPTSTE